MKLSVQYDRSPIKKDRTADWYSPILRSITRAVKLLAWVPLALVEPRLVVQGQALVRS
jgi:hypothetical protein